MAGDAVTRDDQRLAARDVDIVVGIGRHGAGAEQRQQQDEMTQPYRFAHRGTSAPGAFRYLKIASRLQ
jgi:hypothetical protein